LKKKKKKKKEKKGLPFQETARDGHGHGWDIPIMKWRKRIALLGVDTILSAEESRDFRTVRIPPNVWPAWAMTNSICLSLFNHALLKRPR
jgi:hypothetical protein